VKLNALEIENYLKKAVYSFEVSERNALIDRLSAYLETLRPDMLSWEDVFESNLPNTKTKFDRWLETNTQKIYPRKGGVKVKYPDSGFELKGVITLIEQWRNASVQRGFGFPIEPVDISEDELVCTIRSDLANILRCWQNELKMLGDEFNADDVPLIIYLLMESRMQDYRYYGFIFHQTAKDIVLEMTKKYALLLYPHLTNKQISSSSQVLPLAKIGE
jgi:hypothetical protein